MRYAWSRTVLFQNSELVPDQVQILLLSQWRTEPEARLLCCVMDVSRTQPTGFSEMVGSSVPGPEKVKLHCGCVPVGQLVDLR